MAPFLRPLPTPTSTSELGNVSVERWNGIRRPSLLLMHGWNSAATLSCHFSGSDRRPYSVEGKSACHFVRIGLVSAIQQFKVGAVATSQSLRCSRVAPHSSSEPALVKTAQRLCSRVRVEWDLRFVDAAALNISAPPRRCSSTLQLRPALLGSADRVTVA